ncbi:MAG TPA: hypothetical protein VF601_06265 [Beijerinckiaceae bacterium]
MDASFIDTDQEGAELLRSVLDTGRRGHRRKITDLLGVRDLRPIEAPRPIMVEFADAVEEMVHPGVLAAVAE